MFMIKTNIHELKDEKRRRKARECSTCCHIAIAPPATVWEEERVVSNLDHSINGSSQLYKNIPK